MSRQFTGLAGIFLFVILLVGCTKKPETTAAPTDALLRRGKAVYQTQCIACHNADAQKPGALGPEIFGSSKELLEHRILRAEYPAGYMPKRSTHMMVALPHVKDDIEALHLYLNAK